ncbi:MAG TPA: leucine--tRNA ligase [Bacteroidota bacterium]|nr:leucine--tRNA ligase [Bacteroidota bacterium]
MQYPFSDIEPKWQQYWLEHDSFAPSEDSSKPKMFVLDMFPYPSGAGLHVGHPEGYTATDILCRFHRLKGVNVLHPMGWDAFGLPAERYAMQTNIHPRITTEQNISNFRRQIQMLGLSYDWSREVNTTDPNYYKWTQWIFLKMYESWYDDRVQKARPIAELEAELSQQGAAALACDERFTAAEWNAKSELDKQKFLDQFRIAYISEIPVNWCEGLGTVLANEEVAEWTDKGYTVERKPMRQWMMRITAYSERFLKDADQLDWPVSTLEQQKNWIGRSEGAEVDFQIQGTQNSIRVYTTRPDTLFGATYMVLSPEHPLVDSITTDDRRAEVVEYRRQASFKTELDRGSDKDKSGVFTGGYAINPATNRPIPIWTADYVLMGYGTGAIMAVPAHDERDFDFAKKFNLSIVQVVDGATTDTEAFTGDGVAINSSNNEVSLNGLSTLEAMKTITAWLEKTGRGKSAVKFKLRDWLFSRQRYWGEPLPIIHWDDGTKSAVSERDLPLLLPDLKKFQPSGTTESPLANATEWVNVVDPATGKKGRRETNTMPQWAGSCWYYLRFIDPSNNNEFCSKHKMQYWMPVDLYVGGAEHAVLHLMYARFWHKVLFDLGYVTTNEPFIRLRHQGMILGEDSRKMSKSRGNVINPDDVVKEFGADSLRLFEMFMGPLEEMKPWSTKGVEGVHRFLNRIWRLYLNEDGTLNPAFSNAPVAVEFERLYNQTVKKVEDDILALRFNTAISQMMIFVNEAMKQPSLSTAMMKNFVILLSPFAPHLAEELWEKLGGASSLTVGVQWPVYDSAMLVSDEAMIVVQVNGKIRAKLTMPNNSDEAEMKRLAYAEPNVKAHTDGKQIVKEIIVKNKLVNIVVK